MLKMSLIYQDNKESPYFNQLNDNSFQGEIDIFTKINLDQNKSLKDTFQDREHQIFKIKENLNSIYYTNNKQKHPYKKFIKGLISSSGHHHKSVNFKGNKEIFGTLKTIKKMNIPLEKRNNSNSVKRKELKLSDLSKSKSKEKQIETKSPTERIGLNALRISEVKKRVVFDTDNET